jgi:hypothetical protein
MATTASPVLAGPIGDHCVQGVQHTGTPVGRVETIAGVETYVSDPPTGSNTPGESPKVILYFADIYSPLFINAKLLQDYFAAHGKQNNRIQGFSLTSLSCRSTILQDSMCLDLTTSSEIPFRTTLTNRTLIVPPGQRSHASRRMSLLRDG